MLHVEKQDKKKPKQQQQQKKLPDKLSEEKISNLPEKEFRVMIVKLIQDLRNRSEA